MPKQAKGEVRFSGGIWRARITLKGKLRLDVELPTCRDEAEGEDRALLLTEQAKHLRLAGKVETAGAEALLRELGAATDAGRADVIMVIGELCGAPTLPARLEGPDLRRGRKAVDRGGPRARLARSRQREGQRARRTAAQDPRRDRGQRGQIRRHSSLAYDDRSR